MRLFNSYVDNPSGEIGLWSSICCVLVYFIVPLIAPSSGQSNTGDSCFSSMAEHQRPLAEIDAAIRSQYHGDGLAISKTESAIALSCVFQRLRGYVTEEGLWVHSTAGVGKASPFQIKASAAGRSTPASPTFDLSERGIVQASDGFVGFCRRGMLEEYRVGVGGIRQDFFVPNRFEGTGDLRVLLTVKGCRASSSYNSAKLTLEGSGRELIYNNLEVTDATGRILEAGMTVTDPSCIEISVKDKEAIYPIRIDPTISDSDWSSTGGIPGTSGNIASIAIDSMGIVYFGGSFIEAGGLPINYIAQWNGSDWAPVGSGLDSPPSDLLFMGGDLYAGGNFNGGGPTAHSVAKWDGSSWAPVGSGMSGGVADLVAMGSNLYAGGSFRKNNGAVADYVAKWDGSTWSEVGLGTNGAVHALAVSGSNLYVAGNFFKAKNTDGSEVDANRIATWDGSEWLPLGTGIGSTSVTALEFVGADLFAGGFFNTAGGVSAANIAKWDGGSWSAIGIGTNGPVDALESMGTDLYVGGKFTDAGGTGASFIARWDGTTWSALGAGIGSVRLADWVLTLESFGADLYVGGNFKTAGQGRPTVRYAAKWDGTNWCGLGKGIFGEVAAFAVDGSGVIYAGGGFTSVAGKGIQYIAKWDGTDWTGLPEELNNGVNALAIEGPNLYAGGDFTKAGSLDVSYIARWDGAAWSALGTGASSAVQALLTVGTDLYASGAFMKPGGTFTSGLGKWDGMSWSDVGSGIAGEAYTLVASGTDIYAGGAFTSAGGTSANFIAKWDGTLWSPLGTGTNDAVTSITFMGTDLYAGGWFTMAGGNPANYIAKWNGANWSALGSGMDSFVHTIAGTDDAIYAGGEFNMAGGSSIPYLAQWDGSAWFPLGSGVDVHLGDPSNPGVNALLISNGTMFVGGRFALAGGKASGGVATVEVIPPIVITAGSVVFTGSSLNILVTGPVGTNLIFECSTDLTDWIMVSTGQILMGGAPASFPIGGGTPQFYRARVVP